MCVCVCVCAKSYVFVLFNSNNSIFTPNIISPARTPTPRACPLHWIWTATATRAPPPGTASCSQTRCTGVLTNTYRCVQRFSPPFFFSLFSKLFSRDEDLTGLEGAAQSPQVLKSINFLRVAQRVTTLAEAVETMRLTDHLCSLVDNQSAGVKFSAQLKVALVQVGDIFVDDFV